MKSVKDIRETFKNLYRNNEFIIDKSGAKTLEIIGDSYLADEDVIFGTLNTDYANRELEWYLSESLNVNDIPGGAPTIWKQVSSKDGLINSNYGWCIFSSDNNYQYQNVFSELKRHKDSRRALMIYTRPEMWKDYNKDGMSDFMCTSTVHVLIRNDTLIYIVNQRSCDAVYGYKNDMFWHRYVYNKLFDDLSKYYHLQKSPIIHQVGSLHVYERHFKFLED